jgi:hypothetical protein
LPSNRSLWFSYFCKFILLANSGCIFAKKLLGY